MVTKSFSARTPQKHPQRFHAQIIPCPLRHRRITLQPVPRPGVPVQRHGIVQPHAGHRRLHLMVAVWALFPHRQREIHLGAGSFRCPRGTFFLAQRRAASGTEVVPQKRHTIQISAAARTAVKERCRHDIHRQPSHDRCREECLVQLQQHRQPRQNEHQYDGSDLNDPRLFEIDQRLFHAMSS